MADTAKIKTLYTDADKTEVLYPRTKISAITDNDGVSLEAILDNMVYSSDVKIESAKASDPIDANALGGKAPEFYATKNYVKEEVVDVINKNLADNYLKKETIENIYAPKSYVDEKVVEIIGGGDIVLDGYVTDLELQDKVQELQTDVLEAKTNAVNEAQTYTNQQVKKAAPRNLLDNSDFRNPVNQRGQTSYTERGTTIDRWYISENREINVLPNGIEIGVCDIFGGLSQKVDKLEVGDVVTFAVRDADGNLYVLSTTMSGDTNAWHDVGNGVKLRAISLNNVGIFTIAVADDKKSFHWAALYEGEYTLETLPEYQSKGYQNELLVCRQYDTITGEYIGLRKFSNPRNLLDNSDFRNPVNQRGQTSYSGGVYGIDRWFGDNADSVLTTTENGIIATGAYLVQILERKHVGKVLTICVRDAKGGIAVATCTVQQSTGYSWLCTNTSTNGTFVGILQTDTGVLRANVKNEGGVAIEWVALYEGEYTAATLPEYQPKGYGAELLECRRYYQELDYNALGNGYTIGTGGAAVLIVNTGVQMRVKPSLMGAETFTVRVNGVDYSVDRGWVSMHEYGNAAVCEIVFGNGDLPAKQIAAFFATEKVALSADL